MLQKGWLTEIPKAAAQPPHNAQQGGLPEEGQEDQEQAQAQGGAEALREEALSA